MRNATTTMAPLTVPPPLPQTASVVRPGHRLLRCPRPDCGGRVFVTDVALDETAAVCILCARALPSEGTTGEWAS